MHDDSQQRKLREKAFHDEIFASDGRHAANKFYSITAASRRRYMDRILDGVRQGPVLEYGCGPGSTAFRLAQQGISVVGIDISSEAIRQATERAQREGLGDKLEFHEMDAENLKFEDSSIEVVCGRGILHHLNLARSYAEVARVLRPGGSAVFVEPLGHNPLINWYRDRTPHMRTEDEHPLLDQDFRLAREFFQHVEVVPFHLSSIAAVPLHKMPGFPVLLQLLDAFDQGLFTVLPFLRKHAWAAVLVLADPVPAPQGKPV